MLLVILDELIYSVAIFKFMLKVILNISANACGWRRFARNSLGSRVRSQLTTKLTRLYVSRADVLECYLT